MRNDPYLLKDERIMAAVNELKDLISSKYPGTQFKVAQGEDPVGVYLTAIVDLDDPDEVVDLTIDRTMQMQIDEDLPLYLIPVRTPERAAKLRRHLATLQPYAAIFSK